MFNDIGNRIRFLRKKSGLSQEALAKKIGVSFTTVNRWENGHAVPNPLARQTIDTLWQEHGLSDKNLESSTYQTKFLIVDDEPDVTKIIKQILLRYNPNYVLETAEDGYEAGVKVSVFQPDIVILDMFLPGIRGDKVCRKIRSTPENNGIVIIAISGYFYDQIEQNLRDQGADAILHKPINPHELIGLIKEFQKENIQDIRVPE